MTFVRLTEEDQGTGATALARIRLCKTKRAVRHSCLLLISEPVLAAIGAENGQKFEFMIGEGSDQGKVRLRKDAAGLTAAKYARQRKGYIFSIGHVPAFPDRNEKSKPCEVRILGKDTIELTLPQWSKENKPKKDWDIYGLGSASSENDEDEEVEDESPQARREPLPPPPPQRSPPPPRPAVSPPPPPVVTHKPVFPAPKPRPAPIGRGGTETISGITISYSLDAEMVSYNGKSLEITARAALLISITAKVMPNSVGREFAAGKLGIASKSDFVLDQIADDLVTRLPEIGLRFTKLKGFGFCLAVAE